MKEKILRRAEEIKDLMLNTESIEEFKKLMYAYEILLDLAEEV